MRHTTKNIDGDDILNIKPKTAILFDHEQSFTAFGNNALSM